jgi:hypothetical protein
MSNGCVINGCMSNGCMISGCMRERQVVFERAGVQAEKHGDRQKRKTSIRA